MAFTFIVEETALYRRVGGHEVLRAQLQKLLRCAELRNVAIQIMPTKWGVHSGMSGHMVLLETADRTQLVYAEVQGFVTSRTGREEVSDLWLRYGAMRTQALGPEESAQLIEKVAREL